MHDTNIKTMIGRLLGVTAIALGSLGSSTAQAAVPGITGTTINLAASPAFISQPDGATIYSWGYGCAGAVATGGFLPKPAGADLPNANCPVMQIPGPTLIVTEGQTVTVNLTNNLPTRAGNTSILFPGFAVSTSCDAAIPSGAAGLLTCEAAHGATVSYTFVATTPGTHSYFSGTQGDLQIEMGLYGALVVLPSATPAACSSTRNDAARAHDFGNGAESDFRLAPAAYNNAATCYDREYLFQFSEIDPKIHRAAEEIAYCNLTNCPPNMDSVMTEPYYPAYFMINGRSMPDDMDPIYTVQYPNQPYNGNPHMHPGELTLIRVIGQGRWQHPFHEHGNHVRLLARDGNLLLSSSATSPDALAGPLLFTTTTTPGQAFDGIFYWTGKGLNWDVFGHRDGVDAICDPDANGYHKNPLDQNYYEWCGDHGKALEKNPFGAVPQGGPITLPDANIVANGPWYGGSPYFGPEANVRAVGSTPIPPSGTVGNSPTEEAGFAYMWHSHNEREITTNNIFPGGMLMMMLVDPRAYKIDESK